MINEIAAKKLATDGASKKPAITITQGPALKKSTPSHLREEEGPIIETQGVAKRYGEIVALEDINLKMKRGEFVSIVGPSGAGKSTLLRLITREELPTRGKTMIAGKDIARLRAQEVPYLRRNIGVVFQDFKLLPYKTVWENVAFALEIANVSNAETEKRVERVLQLVGLSMRAKNYPQMLSGGEKQRTSIARALVHSPKILLADEPTGNLDPATSWEIIELLLKINERGTTVVLATHDREVVNRLKRRVVAMRDGKIISDRAQGGYLE